MRRKSPPRTKNLEKMQLGQAAGLAGLACTGVSTCGVPWCLLTWAGLAIRVIHGGPWAGPPAGGVVAEGVRRVPAVGVVARAGQVAGDEFHPADPAWARRTSSSPSWRI